MIRDKDLWSSLIFVVTGSAAVLLARSYPMGSALKMGPAFFPTILGALLVLIGLVVGIRALVTPGERIGGFAWKPVAYVTISTVLFGVLVRGGGLIVAIVVLTILSARASRNFAWGPAATLAVGLAVFSVLVFVKALGLPIAAVGPWLGG